MSNLTGKQRHFIFVQQKISTERLAHRIGLFFAEAVMQVPAPALRMFEPGGSAAQFKRRILHR